ncbi:MAG TPA: hypothetical protein VK207_00895 [Bacteroidales bacterium]|nr:hypothetical protein [Bacteroidales bacterium]
MFRRFLAVAFILSSIHGNPLPAQLLHDQAAMTLVKKDIECIYDFRFDEARSIYNEICRSYPGHPVVFLLRGMTIYWENYPLLPASPSSSSFEDDMNRDIELSEKNDYPGYEAEYLLANLCARGLLLLFYTDNDLSKNVFPLTVSTYRHIRRSFDHTSACTDLYYFTGIYNYYREAYPRIYPVYKPLAALFPAGDIETGLKNLESSAAGSVVMGPESLFMLFWIHLNFENNYPLALDYCKKLHALFPDNKLYLSNYIRNLLLLKRYDEAEELTEASRDSAGNRYFAAQLNIFNGILQEKKYLNYEQARRYYDRGILELAPFGAYGNEYAGYGYFGLSRISAVRGEKSLSRKYRNEAVKRVDFRKINFD